MSYYVFNWDIFEVIVFSLLLINCYIKCYIMYISQDFLKFSCYVKNTFIIFMNYFPLKLFPLLIPLKVDDIFYCLYPWLHWKPLVLCNEKILFKLIFWEIMLPHISSHLYLFSDLFVHILSFFYYLFTCLFIIFIEVLGIVWLLIPCLIRFSKNVC